MQSAGNECMPQKPEMVVIFTLVRFSSDVGYQGTLNWSTATFIAKFSIGGIKQARQGADAWALVHVWKEPFVHAVKIHGMIFPKGLARLTRGKRRARPIFRGTIFRGTFNEPLSTKRSVKLGYCTPSATLLHHDLQFRPFDTANPFSFLFILRGILSDLCQIWPSSFIRPSFQEPVGRRQQTSHHHASYPQTSWKHSADALKSAQVS
jgi:hypothetical protein